MPAGCQGSGKGIPCPGRFASFVFADGDSRRLSGSLFSCLWPAFTLVAIAVTSTFSWHSPRLASSPSDTSRRNLHYAHAATAQWKSIRLIHEGSTAVACPPYARVTLDARGLPIPRHLSRPPLPCRYPAPQTIRATCHLRCRRPNTLLSKVSPTSEIPEIFAGLSQMTPFRRTPGNTIR